jgi:hypothetical protein
LRPAWQIVHETLSRKTHHKKKRAGGVAQGAGPEFKPQYCLPKKPIFFFSSTKVMTKWQKI